MQVFWTLATRASCCAGRAQILAQFLAQVLQKSGAYNPLALPITLIVSSGSGGGGGTAQLTLSPTTLSFVAQPNGVAPQQRTVQVTTTGNSIAYAVSTNQPWLQAGSSSGSTPGTVTVGVNPSGLAVGSYPGNVTVTGGGLTTNLPVTLEITNNPVLQLGQQSVTFNYQTGQALPSPRPARCGWAMSQWCRKWSTTASS